jgi:hypothetical protein
LCRINLQDKVRRLEKEPREEARTEVERLRQSLTTEFLHLFSLLPPSLVVNDTEQQTNTGNASAFDDLDEEPDDSESDRNIRLNGRSQTTPPEQRSIFLPSTHLPNGHSLRKKELGLRVKQATRYLAAIREAIAEKSFQYSHVIRKARSKAVRTRSRALIAKLNDRIGLCCRVYSRARLALVQLGADENTLNMFHILLREDVKASTAIRDPNKPGSSSLKLSWIWRTRTSQQGSGPHMMEECRYPTLIIYIFGH